MTTRNACPTRLRREATDTTVVSMRVAMMTREYPPEVYGGAGVHVTELVAQLRHLCEVDVHCMGAPRDGAFVSQPDPALKGANPALATLSADLVMANAADERDGGAFAHLVHRSGRTPGRAAVRHPARADGPLARADAAVEGRTARRRLPHLVVGGAHRGRGRRRGHRGQLRACATTCCTPTPRWIPAGCTWCATASTPTSGTRCEPSTQTESVLAELGRRPDAPDRRVRRPDHPAEGRRAPGRRGAQVRA